ncbi:MAG: 3-phosphoshikimate 1-carboxyvinyltransferase [Oscillospiraceae bacterium]|nr:3-phosphoshikimate 1-carboxyvinyltransferase [Oscillospiraceae bacterium]
MNDRPDQNSIVLLPGQRAGTVRIPSSKSAVHRLLICAALGEGETTIALDGLSSDVLATAACLEALEAGVEIRQDGVNVTPVKQAGRDVLLPCGESGSTLRFLLPVAGALGASGCFRMEGRLPERPMQAFTEQLCAHGMHIRREGLLLHFDGRLEAGTFNLPGDVSSQYFSGLLLALPLLAGDSRIRAESAVESADYIRMTEQALVLSGVHIEKPDDLTWQIAGGQRFSLPASLRAEGDWSGAAFFLCMGALSELGVTAEGLDRNSAQGDRAVLSILERIGAEVTWEGENVRVRRGRLSPTVIDASAVPDLIPALSLLACGAVGDTEIVNAARLRHKESDRLKSTAKLIRDLGGRADERPDGLVIHGSGALSGGRADPCHDHRIAMSAAVAACLCSESVTVADADCVEKSYPAFWDDLGRCAP